jgi:2-polyprenyl-3-methyl-5-hydroxy-6-metoxy-1,4-benzoquinol methylase
MNVENSRKVKEHFEDFAEDFDRIYGDQNSTLERFVNRVLRKGMRERFAMTLQECEAGQTILDVGCGSGRISLPLAERGARVTGIDYSSRMIELANEHLRKYEAGIGTLDVEFVHGDFMNLDSDELFDVTVALGVFDYVKYPMPLLEKMRNLTQEKIIASYPAQLAPLMPIRKVWLWTKNCPVYFYTEAKLTSMYDSIGVTDYQIIRMGVRGSDYLVKAYVNK